MEARAQVVLENEQGEYSMRELCAIYEVSRETGYHWLRRYREGGLESLQDMPPLRGCSPLRSFAPLDGSETRP
jgi:transposase